MRLTLQEQSLGLPTDEALRNMLARAQTPAMRSFVRSIVQGESLGVSIGSDAVTASPPRPATDV